MEREAVLLLQPQSRGLLWGLRLLQVRARQRARRPAASRLLQTGQAVAVLRLRRRQLLLQPRSQERRAQCCVLSRSRPAARQEGPPPAGLLLARPPQLYRGGIWRALEEFRGSQSQPRTLWMMPRL